MELILQPNRASCLATSAAMVLGATMDEVFEKLGHDGLETVNPELDPPARYRGFHPQEIVDLFFNAGVNHIYVERKPETGWIQTGNRVNVYDWFERRFVNYIMWSKRAVLLIYRGGKGHAVAYEKGIVYDPSGGKYPYEKLLELGWSPKSAIIVL